MSYDESELIAAVQAASSDTDDPLTVERYEAWRDDQPDRYPHSHTIIKHMGSFAEVVTEHTDESRPTAPTYEKADIIEAIQTALADDATSTPLTQREYEAAVPDGPSLTTIRISFSNWREANLAAGVDPENAPPER